MWRRGEEVICDVVDDEKRRKGEERIGYRRDEMEVVEERSEKVGESI